MALLILPSPSRWLCAKVVGDTDEDAKHIIFLFNALQPYQSDLISPRLLVHFRSDRLDFLLMHSTRRNTALMVQVYKAFRH